MKSKSVVMVIGLILIILIAGACTQRIMDYTLISSKNIDFSKASHFTRGSQRVEGEDTTYIILFIPLGIPNLKDAIDRALEKVPGAVALVDGVVYNKTFWLFIGMTSITIEGTPLIDKSLIKSDVELPSKYIVSFYDHDKNQKVVYLTKDEFLSIKAAIANDDSVSIKELLLNKN